jgi:hypothetical protein
MNLPMLPETATREQKSGKIGIVNQTVKVVTTWQQNILGVRTKYKD